MASPVTVDINYRRLLRSICVKFSLPPPKYGITLGSDERFCSHVDVAVPRCSRFMEIITCWGSPSTCASHSAEDAARVAIGKLSIELAFEVRDVNYEQKKHYKNLYERVSQEYEDLQNECEMLRMEHTVLKRFYNSLVEEKDRMLADWTELKKHLDKCSILLNQSNADSMDAEPSVFAGEHAAMIEKRVLATGGGTSTVKSAEESDEDPEAPPGYYGNRD